MYEIEHNRNMKKNYNNHIKQFDTGRLNYHRNGMHYVDRYHSQCKSNDSCRHIQQEHLEVVNIQVTVNLHI